MPSPYSFALRRQSETTHLPLQQVAIRWALSNKNILAEEEIEKTFDELNIRNSLSYVNICPTGYEKDVLTPSEIYAVRTKGLVRDIHPEAINRNGPPPATSGGGPNEPTLYTGGTPFPNGVFSDRLNSSTRFTRQILDNILQGQKQLQDTLASAEKKLGAKRMKEYVQELND